MAVKSKTLRWSPSVAQDVVGYNLYIEEAPNPVVATSTKIELGNVNEVVLNDHLNDIDGTYNLGLSARDDGDNEGPITVMNDVPLDFIAPDAPTNLEII